MNICPLCGSSHQTNHLLFEGYSYKKCNHCSLVFLDKDFTPAPAENNIYNQDYIEKRGHDALNSNIAKAKNITAVHYLNLLEKLIPKGNLLEIGCSTGITLKAAEASGWRVYGVEINQAAIDIARERLNIQTIKLGPLNQKMFIDNFFSAVLMFDVLEHLRYPLTHIEIVRNKLKQRGLVLIITPNINSLSAKLLKDKWPHLFLEHVCLYSPKSLQYLLERNGFKIIKMSWAVKFVSLNMITYHLKNHPHLLFSKPLLFILSRLKLFENIIFPLNIGEICVLAEKQ